MIQWQTCPRSRRLTNPRNPRARRVFQGSQNCEQLAMGRIPAMPGSPHVKEVLGQPPPNFSGTSDRSFRRPAGFREIWCIMVMVFVRHSWMSRLLPKTTALLPIGR